MSNKIFNNFESSGCYSVLELLLEGKRTSVKQGSFSKEWRHCIAPDVLPNDCDAAFASSQIKTANSDCFLHCKTLCHNFISGHNTTGK